jgi:predicted CoA-binding protein
MKEPITLIVGASPNPERYSFMATCLLKKYGHKVYAYGIKKGSIEEEPIQLEWPAAGTIDTITLYVGPEGQKPIYDTILNMMPRRIIFNPGTENPELEALAQQKGIQTLEACTLVMLKTNQY